MLQVVKHLGVDGGHCRDRVVVGVKEEVLALEVLLEVVHGIYGCLHLEKKGLLHGQAVIWRLWGQ
jgi:hypothetical protein